MQNIGSDRVHLKPIIRVLNSLTMYEYHDRWYIKNGPGYNYARKQTSKTLSNISANYNIFFKNVSLQPAYLLIGIYIDLPSYKWLQANSFFFYIVYSVVFCSIRDLTLSKFLEYFYSDKNIQYYDCGTN